MHKQVTVPYFKSSCYTVIILILESDCRVSIVSNLFKVVDESISMGN